MNDIDFVPETHLANDLLLKLLSKHKSVAVVVDEFGGTSGIVTVEDIVEEILGEIRDEHDDEDLVAIKVDDSTYIFSGRQEIDNLNETFDLNLPEGDYDTMAGLVLHMHEDIPKLRQIIDLENYVIKIEQMDGFRIDKVKLTLKS